MEQKHYQYILFCDFDGTITAEETFVGMCQKFAPDIFHAALANGVDILISDTNDPKISARIPEWFRKAVAAETFVVFPLCIKGNAVAMIYADRALAGEIVISEKELSLLRTLRNQAVMAFRQAG